jgi:CubicO group peptidase (beta-lactamase class C family)
LPDFAVTDPEVTQRLTVRDAFCACTGVPQRDPEFIFTSSTLTPTRLVTSVRDFPLTAPLGEQFQYSNQMFAIGGYAAAAAVDPTTNLFAAYDTAMRQRLLDPLGMPNSTFSLEQVQATANWASPHGLDLDGAYHATSLEEDERHVLAVAPAGALWSSASEMARFVQMELADGVAADQTRVVSRTNLDATWQPQVSLPMPATGERPPDFPEELVTMSQGYALGWVTGDYYGQPLLWHSGGTFGYSSQVALLPEADLGLVILTNGINAEYFKLGVQFRLFELLFDQPETIGPAIDVAMAAEDEQIAALHPFFESVDPGAVAAYLGQYTHPILGDVTIAQGREGTVLFDAGEFQADLRAFRDPQSGAVSYLTSDLPLAGVTTVTFTQEGGEPVMTFTDPTTGEGYIFTSVGTAGIDATPSA